MRKFAFVIMAFIAACSSDANHLGNPLLLPLNAVGRRSAMQPIIRPLARWKSLSKSTTLPSPWTSSVAVDRP